MREKNELLDAHKFRFACKEFDVEKKISDEDFNYILDVGELSPSSFGWEPWKFIVVQNMDLREKLKEFTWGAQGQLPTASHFVLFMVRRSEDLKKDSAYLKYISEDVQQLPEEIVNMKANFFEKFKENDFDLTDDRKMFDWASKQAYLPLANMMTAAAYIDIDSCPIEGFDRKKVETLLEKAGVVDTNRFGLSVMAAFGYRSPGKSIHPKTRQSIEKVVQWIN